MNISRREFSKLGALGLASQWIPDLEAQPSQPKVGYCVIGLGRIAEHFMPGAKQSSNSQITALVSGHRDKAERIAKAYGIPSSSIYSYEDMDRIRDNKAIDAVYVALPNSMHAEYTIRSAKAGKHVLCEKPMCVSVAEAEQMIAACNAANVKLMIAYRCHFEPSNLRAVQLIRDGSIGKVQAIESSFGFNIAPNEWRSTMKLAGGGPLMDVGVYCLNATRYLTGEEPAAFTAVAANIDNDGRFQGVEESIAWTTKFPSGVVAACNTTYGAQMNGFFRVHGSKGWIELSPAFNYDGQHLRAEYSSGTKDAPLTRLDEPNPTKDPFQFTLQAEHFSDCIRNNKTPKTPGEEGLRDMQCMREIYKAAGITAL